MVLTWKGLQVQVLLLQELPTDSCKVGRACPLTPRPGWRNDAQALQEGELLS